MIEAGRDFRADFLLERMHTMDLTVRQVAAIFDVPEGRIYRWVHDDGLPSRQVNGNQYFNRTELLEWATVRRVSFDPDLLRGAEGGTTSGELLVDALSIGGIITDLTSSEKSEVLKKVVDRMRLPDGFDRSVLTQLLLAREAAGSTAVGGGIAIPHPRHPVVLPVGSPSLTLCYLEQPVQFGALDNQPVDTLFVLVSPTIRAHLRMLARIACALRDESFVAVLKRRGKSDEVLKEVRRVEDAFARTSVEKRGPD
jgi:PTS system nitrogen regulatory IIA component